MPWLSADFILLVLLKYRPLDFCDFIEYFWALFKNKWGKWGGLPEIGGKG